MIRKAVLKDSQSIKELVNSYAEKGMLLPRSVAEIQQEIRSFYVAESGGKVVGCCSLSIFYPNLGEIRSLAVSQRHKNKGIGSDLVRACITEGSSLGLREIFTLTYIPEFFEKLGFSRIKKEKLHPKIWGDCLKCPRFPNCDETALIISLGHTAGYKKNLNTESPEGRRAGNCSKHLYI